MEEMLVIVFDNQARALEGLQILRDLDKQGDISIYEAQTVAKDPSGAVYVIDTANVVTFPKIGGGTAVGAVVGLLAGPVGVPVGAAAGALIGSISDLEDAGVTDEFVNDIKTALTPGKVAVVADVT